MTLLPRSRRRALFDEATYAHRRKGTIRHLLERAARTRPIAEEYADPEHALNADRRDFDERPIAHFIGDGEHASIREVDVGDGRAVRLKRAAGHTSVEALREHCSGFLDAAAGGSMLISDLEEMPAIVQDVLLDLLAGLEFARRPSAAVRLISGTTVSLLDRVSAGTFSDRLFYRLNIIHLMARDDLNGRPTPIRLR